MPNLSSWHVILKFLSEKSSRSSWLERITERKSKQVERLKHELFQPLQEASLCGRDAA